MAILAVAPAGVVLLLLEGGEEGGDPEVVLPPPFERAVDDALHDQAEALAGVAQARRRRHP